LIVEAKTARDHCPDLVVSEENSAANNLIEIEDSRARHGRRSVGS